MGRNHESFAGIIYVTEIEKQAVDRIFEWKDFAVPGDEQVYREAFVERDGKRLRIIAAQQDEMGMTASATLTMKLNRHFAPEYVIMPGIAAGTGDITTEGNQEYGDVLLATSVWNYSNGKYVPPHEADIIFGEIGFSPRPTMVRLQGDYLDLIEKYIETADNEFYVHCGPLASGTAVVANKTIIRKQVITAFQNTEGVEMEGYGVAYAAKHAPDPKPKVIIAKSICDFGDERKDDKYQKFAAFTSCGFVKDLLENVLPYTGK